MSADKVSILRSLLARVQQRAQAPRDEIRAPQPSEPVFPLMAVHHERSPLAMSAQGRLKRRRWPSLHL